MKRVSFALAWALVLLCSSTLSAQTGAITVVSTAPQGEVATREEAGRTIIEIHDSGPGLSSEIVDTLFEPTISFKKHGMGLGLSIAKKNALVSGGDVVPIRGELGGAAFRIWLPS